MSISDSFCENGVPYYRGQDIYNLFIIAQGFLACKKNLFNFSQPVKEKTFTLLHNDFYILLCLTSS